MGFSVKVDLSNFDKRFSRVNLIRARKAAADEARKIMNSKYVPSSTKGEDKKTGGSLRSMSYVSDDGSEIVYTAKYARAQFYGIIGPFKKGKRAGKTYKIHNYTTPGTSKRWDLRLKGNKEDMSRVMDTFNNGLKWEPNEK